MADPVGARASRQREERQDIFLFYWWPDYADPYSWFINLFHDRGPAVLQPVYYYEPEIDKQIDAGASS